MDSNSNWQVDANDIQGPYAPNCASRAAEGFYSGALLGAVWGVVGHGQSSTILPLVQTREPPRSGGNAVDPTLVRGAERQLQAFAKGVAGYTKSSLSTAGVFGVFVGVYHAGTCVCEHERGGKDWINSGVGGFAAGAAVAILSKHTRTPRIVGAHAVGGAAVTSLVAILSSF